MDLLHDPLLLKEKICQSLLIPLKPWKWFVMRYDCRAWWRGLKFSFYWRVTEPTIPGRSQGIFFLHCQLLKMSPLSINNNPPLCNIRNTHSNQNISTNKKIYGCTSIPDHFPFSSLPFSGPKHPQGLFCESFPCVDIMIFMTVSAHAAMLFPCFN